MKGLTSKQLARFLRLCAAFVIELVSASGRRKAVEAKMQDWIDNGAPVAWLVGPYKKSVAVYEAGKQSVTTEEEIVHGTGPVLGFDLNAAEVWSCYEP